MTSGALPTPVETFVESLGLVCEDDMPRTAGRIMALMLIREGPLGFDELADILQVSRGSISNNTRLLEDRGVIERVSKPGDRKVYYRLTDDPYGRLLEDVLRRMERIREIVREAGEEIPSDREAAHDRLGYMDRYYSLVIRKVEEGLEEWREEEE